MIEPMDHYASSCHNLFMYDEILLFPLLRFRTDGSMNSHQGGIP